MNDDLHITMEDKYDSAVDVVFSSLFFFIGALSFCVVGLIGFIWWALS